MNIIMHDYDDNGTRTITALKTCFRSNLRGRGNVLSVNLYNKHPCNMV